MNDEKKEDQNTNIFSLDDTKNEDAKTTTIKNNPIDDKNKPESQLSGSNSETKASNSKEICLKISGLNWWITDRSILSKIKSSINCTIKDLIMRNNADSGKFEGEFAIILESPESESYLIDKVRKINFNRTSEEEEGDNDDDLRSNSGGKDKAIDVVSIANYKNGKIFELSDSNLLKETMKKPKPAFMLYEDAANPIPVELLSKEYLSTFSRENEQPKKGKKEKVQRDRSRDRDRDRNRDRDRDRSRERDRRGRDRDYDYDYDYSYSYKDRDRKYDDYDYRDRERDRKPRYRDDERDERNRDKRRK